MMPLHPLAARITDHARSRALPALVVALIALAARFAAPAPPARTVDAVARMLGDAVEGTVGPEDFIWEERGGFLHDALIGRRVLFLAAGSAGGEPGPADLYRARVRLTRSGRPIELGGVRNLSETPVGDDRELVARGRLVAFTTAALGGVQGVTLLDLGDEARGGTGERLRAGLMGWLETGSLAGAARAEIAFEAPPAEVKIDLADGALVMALGPEGLPAALDLGTLELNTGGKDAFGARAQRIPRPSRSFAEIAEIAAERLIGPRAGRAVERIALAAGRLLRRRAPPEPVDAAAAPVQAQPGGWPPAAVTPAIDPALPGEGAWVAADGPYLAAQGGEAAEACFYRTFLRPDPARPEARVALVAIDTRRIDLRLQAGYEAPRPTVGPRGTGELPARPAVDARGSGAPSAPSAPNPVGALPGARVVAAIGASGADRSFGMIAGGRALIPPRPGAPTLAVDRHGRPALGPWPDAGPPPGPIVALLQGAPVHAGDGPAAPDDDLRLERAALCVGQSGFAIHAWGRESDAAALGKALARAGCEAALGLGRGPAPLGFAYLDRRDGGGWQGERLSPAMSLAPERLAAGSPSPFVYLVLREPAPALPLPDEAGWAPDGGTQPRPSWLPGVYAAEVIHLGARVRLLAFAPDRFAFRVRAGAREVAPRGAPELPRALANEEQARAMVAIGLGTGRRRGARGLVIGGVA
ncbi:MAG: hypothetical protein IT372_17080, partial [Polyangiaceae bacterium]|nr:hypothetical protein [Polyangiaceae bacterium]